MEKKKKKKRKIIGPLVMFYLIGGASVISVVEN